MITAIIKQLALFVIILKSHFLGKTNILLYDMFR